MTNRLPLPLSTLKTLNVLISESGNNLWLINPMKNIVRNIASYDYADAIKSLGYLQQEFPELMNYEKEIKAILRAEKKYNLI